MTSIWNISGESKLDDICLTTVATHSQVQNVEDLVEDPAEDYSGFSQAEISAVMGVRGRVLRV